MDRRQQLKKPRADGVARERRLTPASEPVSIPLKIGAGCDCRTKHVHARAYPLLRDNKRSRLRQLQFEKIIFELQKLLTSAIVVAVEPQRGGERAKDAQRKLAMRVGHRKALKVQRRRIACDGVPRDDLMPLLLVLDTAI